MKKRVLIILAVLIVIVAVGAMIYASITLNNKNNEEDKHLVEISVAELQEKCNNKESFVLIITQTTCSHCALYKPKAKQVFTKYDIIGYEIAIDTISSDELAALREITNTEGNGTPTTVFIIDGEEKSTYNRIIGDAASSKLESRLKQLGYIE